LTKTPLKLSKLPYVGARMKKALALAMMLVISVSVVAVIQTIDVASANFFPGDALAISSPISGMVYSNTSISVEIVARVADPTPEVVSITCCLDDNYNVTLTDLSKTLRLPGHIDGSEFAIEIVLKNLAEGNHTLEAYSQDAIGREMSASAEFVIDTSYTEPLTVLSPQNRTYYSTEVPLTFVCREDGLYDGRFYHASYMLDGIGSDIIYDNLTLTDLSVGSHIVMVGVSTSTWFFGETVYFSISEGQEPATSPTPALTPTPSPSPEPTFAPAPSPTPTFTPEPTFYDEPSNMRAYPVPREVILGIAVTVAVSAVGLGLLVYLIKRK
jgi:hypothetical protein